MAAGDLGVRGRRRERGDAAEGNETTLTTPVKRRKLEEEVDVESRIVLSPCVQATNRGGIVARNSAGASETSVVIVRRRDSPVEEQCQIPSSDYDLDRASVSCCSSSNRSEEKSKRRIEFVDVEEDNGADDQTGTSWIYDNFNTRRDPYSEEQEESVNMDMEIQASSEDVDESRRRLKMQKKSSETVKEDKLEEFFQAAEKDLRNKMLECSMKYNFDFEKDEPLSGRYEWEKMNQ
uniref:Cyclin-dependent kinase inhibitor 2 n=1 Tax=Noccaea caerulescens TaxID=107243 RepID=A0A1J3EAY9_NOCCA